MADEKKAVLFYCDLIHIFEQLEDDEAGKLIKHYCRYINDKNPEAPDRITQLTFEPIKQTLKRDLKTWEKKKEKRSEAGKKGMDKRWGNYNNVTNPITNDNNVINPITNITVIDNDIVIDSVKVIDKVIDYDYYIVNGKIEKGNVVDWYLKNHQPNYEAILMQLQLSKFDLQIKEKLREYFINGFSFNDYKHIANSFKKHISENQKIFIPQKIKRVF